MYLQADSFSFLETKTGFGARKLSIETNYAPNNSVSSVPYDHFSLLRTLEAGFGLPCLNHACDDTSLVMNDVFGGFTK